jgi:cytoskeletal protein CcmA (bactofilin family)
MNMSDPVQYQQIDASVNSIIGEGTTLRGDFDLNGLLRIDGTFFGKVKTNGRVLVGKNGIAESTIIAGTVVIGGKVRGEIIATDGITLLSTGEMIGTIITSHLVIEEGVMFDGKCEVVEDKERMAKIRDEAIASRFKVGGKSVPEPLSKVFKKSTFEQPLNLQKQETKVP